MSVTMVRLGGHPGLPLLVLGPSLGTPATTLWSPMAAYLARDFHVVAWDLPGHGHNRAAVEEPVTIEGLAADVRHAVDALSDTLEPVPFHYAGVSTGGLVGLQLALDTPARLLSATIISAGATIGSPESWAERVEVIRASGTSAVIEGSAARWFGPGFIDREPELASALLHGLRETADDGYAAVCEALGLFDVRDRLGAITVPVLAVAGSADQVTPPDSLREIAEGVATGRLVVIDGVSHLAPAEAPDTFAGLIRSQAGIAPERDETTIADVRADGLDVRRAVLGDAHVDRASGAATDFTRDFQDFITEYAWGGVWTRPGLDRRERSMITLTALVAGGHHEELALHLRAARTNGLTVDEIKEVLLQSAIYCGVPAANTAFRIAQQVLAELGDA